MTHPIVPTGWDARICADCGFPAAQHAVLYGEYESTEQDTR